MTSVADFIEEKTNFQNNLALTALRLDQKSFSENEKTVNENIVSAARKIYTLKEVREHDSITDCWVIIYDRIYDLTNFLSIHPGGYDLLLEYAGRDASLPFRGAGHSKLAVDLLKDYEIGELPLHERLFRCNGPFQMISLPD